MKKGALSSLAACFLFVGAPALAQPIVIPAERLEAFPVRTMLVPGASPEQPAVTFSGTSIPSITSRASVAFAPGVCGSGLTVIGGSSVIRRELTLAVTHDGSGSGPIPDVTSWTPHVRVAKDADITVEGRNLNPTQLVAMVGSAKLTAMAGSTSTKVLFKADTPQVGPLVVYNMGGTVRTLEATYRVFDPTVSITRVVPTSFKQGDIVTLCGKSLFQASLQWNYSPDQITDFAVPVLNLQNGNFVMIGDKALRMLNAAVSEDGSRMTFIAGDLFKWTEACVTDLARCPADFTPTMLKYFWNPILPPPASQAGALTFWQSGSGGAVSGPTVTWQPSGPNITKFYGVIFHGPLAVLPSDITQSGIMGWLYVEGTNLKDHFANGQWRIGSTPVSNSYDAHGDGTLLILYLPDTASSGQICGTENGITACTPNPFVVFGGPSVASFPASPLSIGTTYTIDGINLQPPADAAGLTYQFAMLGLEATDPSAVACNRVLKVLDHTAYHIVFRIGDPGVTAPSGCNDGPLFNPGDPGNANYTMNLWGFYNGQNAGIWIPQHFYLAR